MDRYRKIHWLNGEVSAFHVQRLTERWLSMYSSESLIVDSDDAWATARTLRVLRQLAKLGLDGDVDNCCECNYVDYLFYWV